jgi:hypothetical protein
LLFLPGDRGTKKQSAVLWPDLEPCALGSGASTACSGVKISGAVENEASGWQPAVHATSKRGQDAFFPFPVSRKRQFKNAVPQPRPPQPPPLMPPTEVVAYRLPRLSKIRLDAG